MDEIHAYVKKALTNHPDLAPALQLNLTRKCFIREWVDLAVRALIRTSWHQLLREDWDLIGIDALFLIQTAKASIDAHRMTCAINPPPVIHTLWCLDEEDCTKAWKDAWFGTWDRPSIMLALIHPDIHVPGADIVARLEKLNTGEMSKDCRECTIARVIGSALQKSILRKEEDIISWVIAEVGHTLL
ncbi:hypothetical protein SCP_0502360 [Sparassis crispa]|uniref:Uncharacterized protein n=1 Tax=Sparassis crispa TaxID=139825 RepID=A0A401GM16_9APHY|nr:hypothetical protein SCP_0502360 [Sparassis crispa]GBE83189.1 hypothetical protein SCP_0502360 [Sparassis crispa]